MGKVIDKDKGFKKMMLNVGKRFGVTVGVTDPEVAEYAAVHEFGAPEIGIPQRSFIRGPIDDHEEELRRMERQLAQDVLRGRLSPKQAEYLLGERAKEIIQSAIRAGIDPPNAPSTIERKGSSTPLIDTGDLLKSIGWKSE